MQLVALKNTAPISCKNTIELDKDKCNIHMKLDAQSFYSNKTGNRFMSGDYISTIKIVIHKSWSHSSPAHNKLQIDT